MAVEEASSKNTSFFAKKFNPAGDSTLDHVKRILSDHDYIRSTSQENRTNGEKAILIGEVTTGRKTQLNEFEVLDGATNKLLSKTKAKKSEDLPNEAVVGQSTNLLTPATSPGRCETWSEGVVIKMDSHLNTADLTPPTTPPVLEPQELKTVQTDCIIPQGESLKAGNEALTVAQPANSNLHRKRKSEDVSAEETGGEPTDVKKAKLHFEFQNDMNSESTESCEKPLKDSLTKVENCFKDAKKDKDVKRVVKSKETKESVDDEKKQCEGVKTDQVEFCKETDENSKCKDNPRDGVSVKNDVTACVLDRLPEGREKRSSQIDKGNCDDERNRCSRKKDYTKHDEREYMVRNCDSSCRKERKRRRRSSRRLSTDEESSDEDRYDPRRCERSKERCRASSASSYEKEKRREHDRGRSERDYRDRDHDRNRKYSDERRRQHRRHDRRSEDKCDWRNVRDIEHERKVDFRLGRSLIRDTAKEERRVVYVGGLPYGTTRDELWERLRRFGSVEKVSVHMREGGRDNYGFVTFFEPEDARECIERGNSDPKQPYLDLCFGGRRQYCGGSYVDFDSKTSHIEELSEVFGNIREEIPEEEDFDTLLRKYQEDVRPGKSR